MPSSAIDSEVLRLRAAVGSIDQLVTPSLFKLSGEDPESSIIFHSETEQRLFNILLVDLLNPMDLIWLEPASPFSRGCAQSARHRISTWTARLHSFVQHATRFKRGSIRSLGSRYTFHRSTERWR